MPLGFSGSAGNGWGIIKVVVRAERWRGHRQREPQPPGPAGRGGVRQIDDAGRAAHPET